MANTYQGYSRGYRRPAPVAPLAQKFTRAEQNFAVYTKVSREIKDGNGQVIGNELVTENRVQGRVLHVKENNADGKPVLDRYNRQYIGVTIEIEPGMDRFFSTADPVFHEQLLKLVPGDLIYAVGRLTRNGNGRGFHAQLTQLEVLESVNQPDPTPAAEAVAGPRLVA